MDDAPQGDRPKKFLASLGFQALSQLREGMSAIQVLLAMLMIAVYLAVCFLLLADTVSPQWALFFIALHVLYSVGVVWLYAFLKVTERGWANLLIPLLTTTSTLGIAIWLLFQPEQRMRKRHRND
ncbi:MAG: hypothetical protein D6742_16090 [Cyanobacteria bacterium J069]|nr:MAG: hypothetical protein D6742_16090 [Cyanobacteria bacterium J069]